MTLELDKIDHKILEYLLQDARTPFSTIADRLGVSTDTVSKRYVKLKRRRIIRFTTLFLDISKIGGNMSACLNIATETGHSSEVENRLREFSEIFVLGKTFGTFDFFALVSTPDLESLDQLRDKISSIHQIKLCDVSIITRGLHITPVNQLPQNDEATN